MPHTFRNHWVQSQEFLNTIISLWQWCLATDSMSQVKKTIPSFTTKEGIIYNDLIIYKYASVRSFNSQLRHSPLTSHASGIISSAWCLVQSNVFFFRFFRSSMRRGESSSPESVSLRMNWVKRFYYRLSWWSQQHEEISKIGLFMLRSEILMCYHVICASCFPSTQTSGQKTTHVWKTGHFSRLKL